MKKKYCAKCGCARQIMIRAEMWGQVARHSLKTKLLCMVCFLSNMSIDLLHAKRSKTKDKKNITIDSKKLDYFMECLEDKDDA